jgi:uncharacterized protein (TIGR04255 family)
MSPPPIFKIDFNEKFPSLEERAPCIEAVIHWQATASKTLDPDVLRDELVQRLPDYPICEPQHGIKIEFGTPDNISEVAQTIQWNGFRMQDEKHHVAQFTPLGAVFSRLEPYETWENFQIEAMRFWDIFLDLAAPESIQRLGVRYINRIPLRNEEQPSTYLKTLPSAIPELELPTESFFYQDTYQVPGYPYHVNWVRTIQSQQTTPVETQGQALIIDIDVFTTNEFIALDRESLIKQLDEMRWIKNKIFFSCITQTALTQFGA